VGHKIISRDNKQNQLTSS